MRRPAGERGVVLLMTFVVVVVATLLGTSVLFVVEAEMAASRTALGRVQARSLAWSGVQAALAELATQRESILEGVPPEVTREWTLFTDDNGVRGAVRLLPIGAGEAWLVSEASKLDANTATAEMFARVSSIGKELGDKIVAGRTGARYESVEDLLRVPGLTPELLYGPVEGDEPMRRSEEAPAALADLLTVFGFDANVQAGLGENGDQHRGNRRININVPWSDELGAAVAERFGQETADGLKAELDGGTKFTKDSDIVAALRRLSVPVEAWAPIIDAFTTSPDPYLVGRVDLSTASAGALAAVPGIDEAAAGAIVAGRERIDDLTRMNPAWIVTEGIVDAEQFQSAIDHLTTRSFVWRVRVEAGRVAGEEDEELSISERVVLDAVIDVSSQRPRVAYLRDVTLMDTAAAMRRSILAARSERETLADEAPGVAEPEAVPGPPSRPGSGRRAVPARPVASGVPGGDDAPPEPPAPPEARDRRLGRWIADSNGQGGGR